MGQQLFDRDVQVVGRGNLRGRGVARRHDLVAYFQQRFKAGHVGGEQDGFRQGLCVGLHRRLAQRDAMHVSTAAGPNKNVPAGVDRVESGIGVGHRPVIGSRQ